MKSLFIAVLLMSAAGAATAQTVMDGSEQRIGEKGLAEVNALMGRALKDPYSAQLKLLSLHRSKDDVDSYCGAVNAKNEMGGYVGFRLFVAIDKQRLLISPRPNEPDFADIASEIGKHCIN
ncbi:hypothetical protein BA190_27735 [Labrys sp. WJW]|uniref:hypothetical protein n=1 Tax=Labrys sp. WJW TaxID=1737983 RepID=UPI000829B2AA|nr:hypothetical protein [Labrys sp. WJW]OCC01756.1 hypothetical protein BA190_27735 [Labrys sp. WJW]